MNNRDLTTAEAAKRMGLTTAAVRSYIDSGALPGAYKEGRNWKIPEADVDAWLVQQSETYLQAPSQWERFRNHPYVFWPTLIFSGLVSIFLFFFSIAADLDSVVEKGREVGLLASSTPTLTATPSATPTHTPTHTPSPTPTPTSLPFEPAGQNETLIVVGKFTNLSEDGDNLIRTKIANAINENIQNLQLKNVRVAIEPNAIIEPNVDLNSDNTEQARQLLGDRYGASLIIWGQYTGIDVEVNFLNLAEPDLPGATTQVDTLFKPDARSRFLGRDVPAQMVFLSLYALGQVESNQENFEKAIDIIKRATDSIEDQLELNDDFGFDSAYFRLGWLYQKNQQPASAIHNYDQAIILNSNNFKALNNRGIEYENAGDIDMALEFYTRAAESNPDDPRLLINIGNAHLLLKDYDQALNIYNQVLEQNPLLVDALINRGSAYLQIGIESKGFADLNKAIELDPEAPLAYFNRATAFDDQGDQTKALKDYDKAIELDPNLTDAYFNRGLIYIEQSEFNKALPDFDQVIRLGSSSAIAFFNRGLAYAEIGEYQLAINDYDRSLELEPNDAIAYFNRGVANGYLEDFESAAADFTKVIELDPADPLALVNRGLAYFQLGDFEQSIVDFEQYLVLDPNAPNRQTIEEVIQELKKALAESE